MILTYILRSDVGTVPQLTNQCLKTFHLLRRTGQDFFFKTVCLHSSIETLAYKIPRGFCCVCFFSFGATHSFAALTPKGNGALHN